jgi:choice-of-anchor C domain-containing protein
MSKSVLVIALICTAVSAQASAIFSNGFENPPVNPFSTVFAPGAIGPWTVVSGSVDWIGTYWQAADGNGSVDMSGNGPGAISTSLGTVAGQVYTLSFYLAGNPDGGNVDKQIQVQAGNLNEIFTFDTAGQSLNSMGWILESASFTATANDTLTFTSLEESAYGPALDGVTVSTGVPEPAGYALALLGLAGIGLLRRRCPAR